VIIDKTLAEAETTKADILRLEIVRLLSLKNDLLQNSSKSLPFLLDNTIDDYFCSIDERIQNMSKCGTFASNTEILAAAFLLRTQLQFHQTSVTWSSRSELKLAAKRLFCLTRD